MSSEGQRKRRNKAFYRKSAYGAKRQRCNANILEPGIKGFLVLCHNNESSAVRECYNILNEYADLLFGESASSEFKIKESETFADSEKLVDDNSDVDEDYDDIEKALEKEVESIKSTPSVEKRFQNCATKAKNCIFIRTTVDDPVKLVTTIMKDIALKGLKKARYAARMLPIVGTCKAHTPDIKELAEKVLKPVFSPDSSDTPTSFTVLFRARNNNTTTCGKTSVLPALTNAVKEINPNVKFSWTDYDVAVLVEVVCTVCCLSVAPNYDRLRKYNLQELQQGMKLSGAGLAASNIHIMDDARDNGDAIDKRQENKTANEHLNDISKAEKVDSVISKLVTNEDVKGDIKVCESETTVTGGTEKIVEESVGSLKKNELTLAKDSMQLIDS